MADIATLNCKARVKLGTAESRRLRKQGLAPANLYGHQEDAVTIAVDHGTLKSLVHAGVHVVELEGGATDLAMMREVQWDTYGLHVLHVDLLRVNRNEKVELEIPVELRGTAPGMIGGGVLETPTHLLTVECAAFMIPSSIQVRINTLEIGDSLHVKDLEMPAGVVCLSDPEDVVVQIVEAREIEDEDLVPEAGGAIEPELVGGSGPDDSDED